MAGAQAVSSPSRLHRAATILVEAFCLATVVLVPLAVNPWGFAYELPKAALLRGLALLMLAAHLVALAWSPTPPNLHDCFRHWLRRPLVRPALLVGSVALLSTFTSISPLVSLWGSYHRQQGVYLLMCLILWALLVAAHLRTPAQQQRLLATVAVAGSLTALTPFIESFLRYENPLTSRPGGSLGNPIFLGAYLIMAIPFTLAGLVSARRPKPCQRYKSLARLFGWGAALALQPAALLITQSRGPWVGALVGLMLFGALMFWPTHRRLVLGGLAVLIVLTSVLVASLNFDTVPASRLSQLPYVGRAISATNLSGGTVRVRLVLWQAAWKVVTTWPEVGPGSDRLGPLRALVGYGPDTAAYTYTSVYPPELAHIEDPDAIWDRAHNEILDILAMQGWLGLIAWSVLGVACARRGLALWRAASDAAARAWAAAPLAALAAHVVEVQFAFTLTATALMGWLCVAWLAAPAQVRREETEAEGHIGARQRVGTRWRVYAGVAALLLAVAAARLEGGAIWASALVSRARALDRAGQWQESVSLYDRALNTIPWQAAYHQFRGETFYNLARALPDDQTVLKTELLNAADRSLARARRLEPLELEHYSNGGILHAYWSETVDPVHLDTAVAFYRQAFLLAPTRAGLRTDLGHAYHNHARYEEALAEYGAALEIDPQFAVAYYDSGLAWLALDRPDLARRAFRAALELAPDCDVCRDALRILEE
jgi:tetratricopeptide (TPR) repeat protein